MLAWMPSLREDDRADLVRAGHDLHHLGDGVTGLAAGEVDRVAAAPARRELGVDGAAQVVGQVEQDEIRAGDGVGGDHAPSAGGGVDHRAGPAGRGCVANVAAASKASSTVAARVTPAWRMAPSKTASSVANDPVWLAAARAWRWRRP